MTHSIFSECFEKIRNSYLLSIFCYILFSFFIMIGIVATVLHCPNKISQGKFLKMEEDETLNPFMSVVARGFD